MSDYSRHLVDLVEHHETPDNCRARNLLAVGQRKRPQETTKAEARSLMCIQPPPQVEWPSFPHLPRMITQLFRLRNGDHGCGSRKPYSALEAALPGWIGTETAGAVRGPDSGGTSCSRNGSAVRAQPLQFSGNNESSRTCPAAWASQGNRVVRRRAVRSGGADRRLAGWQ